MIFWADAELLGLSGRNWAITSLGADSGNIVRWEPGSQDVPRDPIGLLCFTPQIPTDSGCFGIDFLRGLGEVFELGISATMTLRSLWHRH